MERDYFFLLNLEDTLLKKDFNYLDPDDENILNYYDDVFNKKMDIFSFYFALFIISTMSSLCIFTFCCKENKEKEYIIVSDNV